MPAIGQALAPSVIFCAAATLVCPAVAAIDLFSAVTLDQWKGDWANGPILCDVINNFAHD
jgi:hypothetical protein